MKIIRCELQHLPRAAELFNDYRIFYGQTSDPARALAFIKTNLEQARSQIFLLLDDNDYAVAFSQLYLTYESIVMRPFYILSDLYVDQAHRRHGYAKTLMQFLIEHFRGQGSFRLTLETATTNVIAQHLYESLDYERENTFITYHKML